MANVRRERAARKTKGGRERLPSSADRKAGLFVDPYLFVQLARTFAEWWTLSRITRGSPGLRRLRDITDEVYRLSVRRCRTDTALKKVVKLRRRAHRFKREGKTLQKLFSPNP